MHPVILIAFFVSGLASLVLETVWTREFVVVFGATTLAVSTVLTCFMGGLALGAFVFGRIADRVRRPVLVYAALEAGVGLWALLIPVVIHQLYPHLNTWLWRTFEPGFWAFSMLRFGAVALVILPPTTLMGATLPMLSRHAVRHLEESALTGRTVGFLYAINTTGAVTGAFLATFALLPAAGVAITNTAAAIADILIALLVFGFRRPLLHERPNPGAQELRSILRELAVASAAPFVPTRPQRLAALVTFGLSGFAAMNLQVILNRAMALVLGSSIYSFGVVLLAFLIGLAAGSAAASALVPRIRRPLFALAVVQLGACVAVALLDLTLDHLPVTFGKLILSVVPNYWDDIGTVRFCMFLVAVAAALPATLFLGATFPLTIKAASGDVKRVGHDVGSLYAVNTIGAILGSFASAFLLVPFLSHVGNGRGMELSLIVTIGLHALSAVILGMAGAGSRVLRSAFAVAVAAGFLLFSLHAPHWDQARLTLGLFRMFLIKNAVQEGARDEADIAYYYDGVSTTVSIERWGRHFALKNNGKVEASNLNDMPTQVIVSAYPLLMHDDGPAGRDVVVIGFGSGVSVGTTLEFPIRRVDDVEYEPAVVRASTVFGRFEGETSDLCFDVNHLVYRREKDPRFRWNDPDTFVVNDRLKVINNDGRNFLASTPNRYDVVISEPSNPWITGVSNLFTLEHFRAAGQALKKNGIFGQWVQLYELSPRMVKVILKTFAAAFPHMLVFAAENMSPDIVLLGSRTPIPVDLGRVERAMADPRVRQELERARIFRPTDILARILFASRDEVTAYAGDVPLNTDDNLLIEFAAPDDLIGARNFKGYLQDIYNARWPYGRLSEKSIAGLGRGKDKADRCASMSLSLLGNGRRDEARRFAKLACDGGSDQCPILIRIMDLYAASTQDPVPVVARPLAGPGVAPDLVYRLDAGFASALQAARESRFSDALKAVQAIPDVLKLMSGPDVRLLWAWALMSAPRDEGGDCYEAIALLDELIRSEPEFVSRHPEVYLYLSRCHRWALHFDKALENMQAYAKSMMEMEPPIPDPSPREGEGSEPNDAPNGE